MKHVLTWTQNYEDAIENMKIQFAAISEQKAEVERKLEPLVAEDEKLKSQADEFATRETDHLVNPFRGLFCYWATDSSNRH